MASTLTHQEKAAALQGWGKQVLNDIKNGKSEDPIGRALVDTVSRFEIPINYFESFLHSMSMDLIVDEYETFDDLMEYVYGSAVVIGLQMLPILGPLSPDAKSAAEKLGAAFQLANFIRDIGEDLERGRIYIPISELALFDVTREDLYARKITPNIIAAIKFQIDRVRKLQKEANEGIRFLDKTSRPCIEAASELYCGIVDEVEAIGYDVFNFRAKTSQWRRLKVAFPAYLRAVNARRN
jgi:phytoene synthase